MLVDIPKVITPQNVASAVNIPDNTQYPATSTPITISENGTYNLLSAIVFKDQAGNVIAKPA